MKALTFGRAIALASACALALAAPALSAVPGEAAAGRHPVTVDDLMSLTDLSGLSVSPDGRYAATLSIRAEVKANTYDFHWVLVRLQDGQAKPAGDAGDPVYFDGRFRLDGRFGTFYRNRALWAPDGQGFAYLRQSGGQIQVWRTLVKGLRQEQLTHNAADVEDFVWSEDGRRILFSTAASRAKVRELIADQHRNGFVLTPTTNWSYQFQQPFVDRYAPVGGRPVVWVLDIASGAERKATDAEKDEFTRLVKARDNPVAVRPGPAPASLSMPLLDPKKTRLWVPLAVRTRPEFQDECAAFDCSGRFVPAQDGGRPVRAWWIGWDLFLLRRDGLNRPGMTLWRWPVGRGPAKVIAHSDDNLTDCTRLGAALDCLLQTPTEPRRIVRLDLQTGGISSIYDPNPQWRKVQLGETRWVRFADAAGHETYGVLTLPIGFKPGGRYPMVVIGYGTDNAIRGDGGERYPSHVLAARGFVTLIYHMWEDERIHPYEDFLVRMYSGEETDGKVSYDQISDYVGKLVREGIVDPDRVGIGGHSEALNTIAWGLTHGDLFKAVATDWVRWNRSRYFMPIDGYQAMLQWGDLLRDPYRRPGKIIRNFSLSLHVREVRAPILVNASGLELDSTSQWEALRRFWDAGRPLEMHVAPDEDHVVFEAYHRRIEYRRNLQWFEYWLQDREAPDPVDPEEYHRWDLMKRQLNHVRGDEPDEGWSPIGWSGHPPAKAARSRTRPGPAGSAR